jgi:hypothetical protein
LCPVDISYNIRKNVDIDNKANLPQEQPPVDIFQPCQSL